MPSACAYRAAGAGGTIAPSPKYTSTRSRWRARRRRKSSVPASEPAPSRTPVRTLRLRIGFLRPARRLAPRGRAFLRRGRSVEVPQAALEVVEDEPDRRLRLRRRRDQAIAVPDDEDAPALERDLELRELGGLAARVAPLLGFG